MDTPLRVALVAAAAITVAVVGAAAFAPRPSPFGASPPASPSSSPMAPTSGAPLSTGGLYGAKPLTTDDIAAALPAGRYRIGWPFPYPIDVMLDGSWRLSHFTDGEVAFGIDAGPYIGVFMIDRVYLDPCHPENGTTPATNPSAVVDALRTMKDFTATALDTVQVAGFPAAHFSVTNRIDAEAARCTNGNLLPLFDKVGGEAVSTNGGVTDEFYVLDKDGDTSGIGHRFRSLVVVAESAPDDTTGRTRIDSFLRSLSIAGR